MKFTHKNLLIILFLFLHLNGFTGNPMAFSSIAQSLALKSGNLEVDQYAGNSNDLAYKKSNFFPGFSFYLQSQASSSSGSGQIYRDKFSDDSVHYSEYGGTVGQISPLPPAAAGIAVVSFYSAAKLNFLFLCPDFDDRRLDFFRSGFNFFSP